jgi:hypothetical protein
MNDAKFQLDWIYEAIGNNELDCNDVVLARINELELVINPHPKLCDVIAETGCGCGDPDHCWECAAIRGGCPEDV